MHYTLFLEIKCRARRIGGVGGADQYGSMEVRPLDDWREEIREYAFYAFYGSYVEAVEAVERHVE